MLRVFILVALFALPLFAVHMMAEEGVLMTETPPHRTASMPQKNQ